MGGFFFSIYGYYSYAFYAGSYFVTRQAININTNQPYNAGDIIACFLGVVYGIMF